MPPNGGPFPQVRRDRDPLVRELLQKEKILVREEISDSKIKEELRELKAAVCIPSISRGEYFKEPVLLSVMILGEKLSGESFSAEDLDFLQILANQASITVEYAFILEEFRRHQEQIIQSEKLATLGAATAGIAHELKNPLTFISTAAQALGTKWDDPEFKQIILKSLPAEVERMRIMVEGILGYSRAKELVLQPVEITEVVKRTLALLAYDVKKNNIHIKEDYVHTGKVKGDSNRLMQVFLNIIANAVQAIGEKGGDLIILTRDGENEIKISIADTGPGIPPAVLSKIFDPFYSTKSTGTGLGLAIAKKIIDEHKGTIQPDSIPGRGTTFTICLPRA